jgi:hypothetical protein
VQPPNSELSPQAVKSQKAREKAVSLYPSETWREIEERIFIAVSREPRGKNQRQVLEKELVQARILTARGSTVYFLPEIGPSGQKHPDTITDGYLMEFKTISGSVRQIEKHFKESREKADRVFFKIDSPLTRHAVARKLVGLITAKSYSGGLVMAYFSESSELYYWDVDSLTIKNPG